MRTADHGVITDHALMQALPTAHHEQAVADRFTINGQAIAATSAYEKRINIGSGHKVVRAVVRGKNNIAILGHDGVWCLGADSSGQCSANGMRAYGASYISCYVGGYSRIHGDSYLSGWDMFGSNVYLRDVWIDDDELVLEFFNVGGSPSTVSAWGSFVAK